MTKKIATRALLAIVLGVGITFAAPMDPNTRLEKVRDEIFAKSNSVSDAFNVLRGQGVGGTGTASDSGKGIQIIDADISGIINAEDGNSFIGCVGDGEWLVYPPEPMKVGTNAMTAQDAAGRPFVNLLIKALRDSSDGVAHRVPYTVKTPDGRIQEREATAWNSRKLLGDKKNTYKKFFCFVSVKAHP